VIAFALVFSSIYFPSIPEEGVLGIAKISIDQLSISSTSHQSSYIYKGKIISFVGETVEIKGVPFYLSFPAKKKNRPLANCDYEITCLLKKGRGMQAILKPLPNTPWIPLKSYSFSEARFYLKQTVKSWMERQFTTPSTVQFLSGLVIGEFDDRNLRRDFGRFGLLHLLAISGFHFSIIASLLILLLRPFFHDKALNLVLIIILSLYFLFLGWGPSILRAWFTLLVYLGAYFHERFSSPINSLGACLLIASLIDPLLLENLGFQFSFLTTGAILFGLEPTMNFFDRIFPKRSLETVYTWSWMDQFSYIILGFMKNGLSLSCATTCTALPISLYYFGTFPLLSLVYNIFFPFLVSISMSLLIFGSLLSFIPFLSYPIHLTNDYFTSFILNLTYDIPESWDFVIKTD
jgi:competence protein ComEC